MYTQEVKARHEFGAIVQTLIGVALLALVLLGIGGTIYKVISPDGWIALAFSKSASAGAAALGALVFVALLGWFSRSVAASPGVRNRAADLVVYGSAAAGVVYLSQIWLKGTF